ncbi:MAG: DUF547 domain-containing protein [Gammaproteobacteria bacterium]
MKITASMPRCPSIRCLVIFLACSALLAWNCGAQELAPNFDAFDELLLQNVRNGFVDYNGFAADERFADVVERIGAGSPAAAAGPDSGLAFYINAYNALAIEGILKGRSPDSWWGRRGFFKRQKFLVLGEKISLETLEHERIIPLGDPRIHFAIVCASLSCPRLSSHAYRPDRLNVQLHDAARSFINDPTRNLFDIDRRIAFVSRIFDWYAEDFAKAGGSVQRYIARFVDNAEVQEALRGEEFELRYFEYDWHLNGHFQSKDTR